MIYVIAPPVQARMWANREGIDAGEYELLSRYSQVEAMTPDDRVVEIPARGRKTPLKLALEVSMVPLEIETVRLDSP